MENKLEVCEGCDHLESGWYCSFSETNARDFIVNDDCVHKLIIGEQTHVKRQN